MSVPLDFIDMSIDEYLAAEQNSETRHEYIDGQLFAMTGASKAHNTIVFNFAKLLDAHIMGSSCRVYFTEVKVLIKSVKTFYYPDVLVTCERESSNDYYTETPSLICEVLSPTTEVTDRREKFANYKKLKTLKEYILIHQDRREVEVYRRHRRDHWTLTSYRDSADFELKSLSTGPLSVSLDQIYARVSSIT